MSLSQAPLLYLAHGFGFDPEFWRPLCALLPEHEQRFADLGFHGEPSLPELSSKRPLLGVGHSLGLAWLVRQNTIKFDALVSIGGFTRYTRGDDFPQGVSPGQVRLMRRKLGSDPKALLREFFQLCAAPREVWPCLDDLEVPRLSLALDWLLDWDLRAELRALSLPVLALQAKDDAVTPVELARACFAGQENIILRQAAEGGHCLPLTRPDWCAAQIREFARRIFA